VNSRRAYIYFAAIFLLGILAGGAGTFFLGARLMGPQGGAARRERMLRRMTRDLDLNDSQASQIRAILEETGAKMRERRQQHRPEFEAIRSESHDRIRKVLTPEQTAKFEEMLKKFEEKRRRGDLPPPPPGPPPE
jgi:Spy/CpxP family protein refolding chaperone